jgi:hypothetical protein
MARSNDSNSLRVLIRAAALAAVAFYVLTARFTKGHEADFGKQWLAARLVATGQGAKLFDQSTQRAELERHYTTEVIDRGIWREGIGGPTYPPTFAVVFAPLGWLTPAAAQWVVVQISVLMVIVAARWMSRMTDGRITTESAALATLCLPSFFLAVGVGQNSAVSLAIFVAGFALLSERRDFAAGLVWGLFAMKPTWGFAIAWIPAVTLRPRAYLGMATSAAALVALTIPICGIHSWFDWLAVARQTELFYHELPRWTALSRDLPGLIRRVSEGSWVEITGWAVVGLVIAATAKAWWARGTRGQIIESSGHQTVALLSAAVLSCPRFMFYDMTLAVVPFLLALGGWNQLQIASRWLLASLAGLLWLGTAFSYAQSAMLGLPLDTLALLLLWLWAIAAAHARTSRHFPGEFNFGYEPQMTQISQMR